MANEIKFLDFHTHQLSNDEVNIDILNVRQGQPMPLSNNFFGYGIHPWDSTQEKKFKITDEIASSKNLIYIGETGLDKLKGAQLDIQMEIFKQHISASEKWGKPLLIHCVRCFNELVQLHKEYAPIQKWIVHGYTGSPQLAKQLTEAGFLLSFGAGIFNKKSKAAQSLKAIPKDHFLLETDDSPNTIKEVYEAAAEIVQLSVDELKKVVLHNFTRATSD